MVTSIGITPLRFTSNKTWSFFNGDKIVQGTITEEPTIPEEIEDFFIHPGTVNPRDRLTVLRWNDTIFGFLFGYKNRTYIQECNKREEKAKGVGSALLKEFVEAQDPEKFVEILSLSPAKAWWKKFGFKNINDNGTSNMEAKLGDIQKSFDEKA